MSSMPQAQLRVPFIDLAAEQRLLQQELLNAITGVMDRGDFILGSEVESFEKDFASFCEARFAVGVSSGLSALELILRACGIGPGDEVITAANTFIATALAVSGVGATPRLVDVDPDTGTIDIKALANAITPRTAAIMPVHLYGQPADMDPILEIAKLHGLFVIEDACQAHGARYNGKRTGSLGDAAAFSFYPAKNLGAYGDGGIVVTNNPKIAEYVEMARNYGQREKYDHVLLGSNSRLDTMQAAVLRKKLPFLEERNQARRAHAALLCELLQGSNVTLPVTAPYSEHVWHLFVIQSEHRDALRAFLASEGIATGIHYPIPIHMQKAYADLGYKQGDFPVTEFCAERILSLPMYPEMTTAMIERVAEVIRDFKV